jgi:hypothetical protein
MPKEELAQKRLREESRRRMDEWDAMIPDGAFQDAEITERLSSRHIDKAENNNTVGTSSLERCRES